ncbi:hypothetical protein HF086_004494 [Spodoptera exigua]|uniref:Peptidase A2 domain-containing protein n=1 Tax=Spodoptera exigua TaxID=7107 RepID=A0A922S9S1_SPOEX|nr:hypothetical protein HF086_004494 [Spodoptera exigua]
MSKNTNAGDSPDHEQFWCTKDAVPSFSGQDKTYPISKWIQDIEDNGDIFQWSPTQQLLVARRSLTGTAALWFRAEKTFKTWEELKTAISKEFPDTLDQKTVHELMSARKKKPSESLLEYLYTMKELGKRGKMPDYIAIRYIVDGIPDLESNKIMLYGVTTYSDLKDKFKIYEMVKEKMKTYFTTNECGAIDDVMHDVHVVNTDMKCATIHERNAKYDSDSSNRSIDVIDQDVKNNNNNNNIALFTSRSRQKPLKTVKICDKTAEALVDSGSDINLITDEWRRQLGLSVNSDSVSVSGLGLSIIKTSGSCTVDIIIDDKKYENVKFYVISKSEMPFCIILGNDFLQRVTMCMNGNSVWFGTKDDEWLNCMLSEVNVCSDFPSTDHIKDTEVKL